MKILYLWVYQDWFIFHTRITKAKGVALIPASTRTQCSLRDTVYRIFRCTTVLLVFSFERINCSHRNFELLRCTRIDWLVRQEGPGIYLKRFDLIQLSILNYYKIYNITIYNWDSILTVSLDWSYSITVWNFNSCRSLKFDFLTQQINIF